MGFIKAGDSNLYHEEKGEGPPIVLTHPAVFRETRPQHKHACLGCGRTTTPGD